MVAIGTTPTFTFTFTEQGLDLTQASHVYVTFREGGVLIEKKDEDLTIAEKSVAVSLKQTDTYKLSPGQLLMQVNWTYADGSRMASEIVSCSIGDNLHEAPLA